MEFCDIEMYEQFYDEDELNWVDPDKEAIYEILCEDDIPY